MSQLYVDNIKNRTGGAIGAPAGIVVSGVGTFSGNVSIGGTLSYEDVTNIDSVGIVTARAGIDVTGGNIDLIDNSKIRVGTGDDLQIYHDGSESYVHSTSGAYFRIKASSGIVMQTGNTTNSFVAANGGKTSLYFNGTERVETTSTGVVLHGTASDSIGPLRRLGVNAQSGAYAFVVGDAGKIIRSSGSGAALTLNQNIFTAGDMISVFNVGSGNNTIVQGTGVTLYNTADAATGTRTIAAKGMVTIVCTASNEFAISGSQLT